MARVAFLGLGVMGFPMAGHLAAAGHDVTVFNRTPGRAADWCARHPGRSAATVPEAVAGAAAVFACVGNDADIAAVARAAFPAMDRGAVFVDHTTASAQIARVLAAEAEALGLGFVDAPVSGGQSGAEAGQLTVMCGGARPAYDQAEPLMAAYARRCRLLGPAGHGQLAKMVNQICIAGLVQALAEGLRFAEAAGLDPAAVVDVIGQGAARSWQMENRAQSMVDGRFHFGFAVKWMRKDLAICLEEARHNGAALPVTALVDQFYAEIEAMGGGRWDTSSLIARLPKGRTGQVT